MASTSRLLHLSRALQAGGAASRSVRTLLRPLAAAASLLSAPGAGARCFATQPATSSLPDSSPDWSKRRRPTKQMILHDGCDFEHWLVVMEAPPGDPSNPDIARDEIIDSYIKTLAQVVGSEEEARRKMYSVSTRHYFAFGAVVSEELSYKLKELPKVRWVLPDSYLDAKNKDYGGEPFINGKAVPYDPKYHEEWVRNNARARYKRRSDLDDGSDLNDRSDSDNQGNRSDSDDQGDRSDSDDQGNRSDSDDHGDRSDSDDGNDLDNKSDSDNISEAKEATQMTKAKEATQPTDTTRMTHTTKANEATWTTRTTEATRTTRTIETTRTTEASRTTEVTRTTKATQATRTTEAKEATRTTRTVETTRTTESKETTTTTST